VLLGITFRLEFHFGGGKEAEALPSGYPDLFQVSHHQRKWGCVRQQDPDGQRVAMRILQMQKPQNSHVSLLRGMNLHKKHMVGALQMSITKSAGYPLETQKQYFKRTGSCRIFHCCIEEIHDATK